jgi:glycosyltransferase involved in cell wall biosynthesis
VRIAVFTDNDFDKVNGVTTTLTALLDHAPDDVQPRIYTAAGHGSDAPDYLALASVSMPIPFYGEMRMYLPKLRQYLDRVRRDQVDVIHLTTPGPLGLAALWVASESRLPLVGSFHTNLGVYTSILSGSSQLGRCMDIYMRWLYGRCREVLVPSASTRDALIQSGFAENRLSIWPRGVDTNLFTPAKRSTSLRRRWGCSDDRPVVLYVGRVSREKGLELLPEVLEQVRAMGRACQLVIAGDGPLRPWLEARCPDVIFTGSVGRADVAEIFASSDVFIFPSQTDTAGNVVLEAQASGLPVVVSDGGGPRENMVPGHTGLVCADTTSQAWARAIVHLLDTRDRLDNMRAASRAYALSRRWRCALEPLFDAYRRVSQVHTAPAGAISHAA